MYIRPAVSDDLPRILELYAGARERMARGGNPNQWRNDRPAVDTVKADIESGHSMVIESDGRICGVFYFNIFDDPTYRVIENGAWLNDEPYGVVHRIAGDGVTRGILAAALGYAQERIGNIRIDTHEDNRIMQHLLTKYGFAQCGIIYTDDGTQRLAYMRSRKDEKEDA